MSRKINRVGERYETNNHGWCEVVEYVDRNNVTVRFDDYGDIIKTNISSLSSGKVRNVYDFKRKYIGNLYETRFCGVCEIVDYLNASKVTVRFDDGFETITELKCIIKGNVRNPNTPQILGKGFVGVGKYTFTKNKKLYKIWSKMFTRSYCEKYKESRPTYLECIVDDEWYNFQNFCKWVEENYTNGIDGLVLDKDILNKGNKVYSPKYCVFVPSYINGIFTKSDSNRGELPIGVSFRFNRFVAIEVVSNGRNKSIYCDSEIEAFNIYKKSKEKHIKYIADKYKDEHWLKPKLYKALYEYEVEITD